MSWLGPQENKKDRGPWPNNDNTLIINFFYLSIFCFCFLDLQSKLQPCTKCANYISEDGKLVESIRDVVAGGEVQENDQLKKAQTTIKDLEMELAATKLELVESQCKSQDLEHRINNCDPSRNRTDSWMMKKISSFTAAKKE